MRSVADRKCFCATTHRVTGMPCLPERFRGSASSMRWSRDSRSGSTTPRQRWYAPLVAPRSRGDATMLRVCILTETYHPVVGGGETQARLLAEQLCAGNAVVCVLTRRSDGAFPAVERMEQVRVYRVGPVGRGQLKKWGLLVSTVLPLFRVRHAYDVLFVSGFRILGVPAVLVGRALGKRIVLKADSQGEMSGEFFGAGLARFGLRPSSAPFRTFLALRNAVLRRADAFVAITHEGARERS